MSDAALPLAASRTALEQYFILDTPGEQGFDDLTTLAASICEAPKSVISLLDNDRLWFKSKVGIDAIGLPSEGTFCRYAVQQSEVFIVPDARLDARFREHPTVASEGGVRFYAAAPLITP